MMNREDTFKNILLILASVLFCLSILEIGIRLVYGNQPIFKYPQAIHIPTSYGYKLKPNQRGTYTLNKPVAANSYGFRDREWEMPKPETHIRVMILGDSLTFGNAVRVEDTYPKVLETEIRAINPNAEVLSAAVGGWSTYIEMEFFKNEGISYHPDILIIGFYINDFTSAPEVSAQLNLTDEGRWDGRPEWLRWLPYKYIFLLKRSALITYMRDRIANATQGEEDFSTKLLKNEVDLEEDKTVRDTGSYIVEMKRICDERGIKMVLASIPSINLFWFPKASPEYIGYLKNLSKANGILFVDLSEDFWKSGDIKKYYMYPWDNHLSPEGHRLVSGQLFRAISGLINVPSNKVSGKSRRS